MEKELFFKQIPWSWKELAFLLILVFILVPVLIEVKLLQFLNEWFQNDLYAGTLTGFIMAIIFSLGIYYITLNPKRLSWKEVGFRRFSKSNWSKILGWTVLLIVSSILISYVLEWLFDVGIDNSKTESIQTRLSFFNISIAFVSAAIISPVYEEILYRGFIYRWFRSKFGVIAGLLISSFIFMVVHIPTYNTLPYNFLSGIIFAWTYEKTASIYPAIIIHSAFNGLAVILTVLF